MGELGWRDTRVRINYEHLLEKKLEAIKIHIEKRDIHNRWLIHTKREVAIPMRILRDEIEPIIKILEAEDP